MYFQTVIFAILGGPLIGIFLMGFISTRVHYQAAVIGIEGHVAYSASKAGLLGMTNCMALEWGPKGITANCISPTVVETELGKVGWSGEKGERARAEIPTRRFAQPQEIALAALYLASDGAAMVNGANLLVDGGYTVR